jgi:small subunit ribosomal protein S20
MPHTRSAKKRLRQSNKRRLHNRSVIRTIKTEIKQAESAAKAGNLDQLKTSVGLAIKKLDKAAAHRVVHPNNAARKKSQLARLLNAKRAS